MGVRQPRDEEYGHNPHLPPCSLSRLPFLVRDRAGHLDYVASSHSAASAGLPGCNRSLSRWFLLPVGNSQSLRPGVPARTMHTLGGSRAPFPQPRPLGCGRWQLTLVLALSLPTPPAQCHRPSGLPPFRVPQAFSGLTDGRAGFPCQWAGPPGKLVNKPPASLGRLRRVLTQLHSPRTLWPLGCHDALRGLSGHG